jgi:hypothetical protein
MANVTAFVVKQVNPNQKGGFVTKLYNETVQDCGVFGEKIKRTTLYISGTKAPEVNTEVKLDLDMFEIKEYPYEFMDTNEGKMVTIDCKWLHLK